MVLVNPAAVTGGIPAGRRLLAGQARSAQRSGSLPVAIQISLAWPSGQHLNNWTFWPTGLNHPCGGRGAGEITSQNPRVRPRCPSLPGDQVEITQSQPQRRHPWRPLSPHVTTVFGDFQYTGSQRDPTMRSPLRHVSCSLMAERAAH